MAMDAHSCIVVGISGASGSGKTLLASTLSAQLSAQLPPDSVAVISEDYYYRDQTNVPLSERAKVNYDHPDSMDHALLIAQLRELKAGRAVELPQYDYCHHTRAAHTLPLQPPKVIIVEGILLFTDAALRAEMHFLIFVDAPLDVCLLRRLQRDTTERGRSLDSVVSQYMATVRPMYLQYIEPSRHWADLVVPSWKDNRVAIDVLRARLRDHADPRPRASL